MKTLLLRANTAGIARAAEIIKRGGLVAFPTETVYGLGANAFDAKAVRKIFVAKGRPCDNPIIVHVADREDVYRIVRFKSKQERSNLRILMDEFWPGPLTFVLHKKPNIPKEVSAGLDTVAVRMPSNRIASALIRAAGVPIAAPSANISGRPSPTTARHVLDDLGGKIDAIIDGGKTVVGLESTVLDLTTKPPTLLRPGKIGLEELERFVGPIATHTSMVKRPKSPGMKHRHYAPLAKIIIAKNESEMSSLLARFKKKKIGILRFDASPTVVARNLFAKLRAFDDAGVEIIISEPLSRIKKSGIGLAVIDRLKRAASRR